MSGSGLTIVDKDALVYSRDLVAHLATGTSRKVTFYSNASIGPDGLPETVRHHPIFFRLTELIGPHRTIARTLDRCGLRKVVRLLEMAMGYGRIVANAVGRPSTVYVINLSRYFAVEAWTVRTLRRLGRRVVVIAHEVAPKTETAGSDHIMARRRAVLESAGEVVVHGAAVRQQVEALLNSREGGVVIYQYPHPLPASTATTSVTALPPMTNGRGAQLDLAAPWSGVTFGFFGSIRRDKGLRGLLHAWEAGKLESAGARLVIVGRRVEPMPEETAWLERQKHASIFVFFDQVDHDVLLKLMDRVDVLVMPYETGSQSGILALGVSRGRACLVSAVGDLRNAVPEPRWDLLTYSKMQELPHRLRALAQLDHDTLRDVGEELRDHAAGDEVGAVIRKVFAEIVDGRRVSGSREQTPHLGQDHPR